MKQDLVVVGGGIGGLAAAVAATRAGARPTVLEQAAAFGEVGAGLQFGPNVTRILRQWPQAWQAVQATAAVPQSLDVRDGFTGRALGRLRLGADFVSRYDAPYFTLHRADAHAALLAQARADGVPPHTGERVQHCEHDDAAVRLRTEAGADRVAAGLLAADGLWSHVRGQVVQDGAPVFTGHLAYRTLLAQRDLPAALRSSDVTVWLAPGLHVVAYPVRAGDALNLVCLAEGPAPADPQSWDSEAVAGALQAATRGVAPALRALLEAAPQWRLWALHARAPVASPAEMARGRVALVGDAAHPMLPYLAQGAGMAIEDAWALQQVLPGTPVPQAFARYAQLRWHRCARVQARSRRNATIFHAQGVVRGARDIAMRLLGEQLLDVPWLYRGT